MRKQKHELFRFSFQVSIELIMFRKPCYRNELEEDLANNRLAMNVIYVIYVLTQWGEVISGYLVINT